MKLSVIVCVYNTEEKLFEKCLNSIYTSTLEDFEVVVIDDGSTKKYTEIIKKYNPVYAKTQNRGLLAARLYGMMLAKGEYVAFVDSDDTVTFNYHAPMVDAAIKNGCDIVINDWAFKTESSVAYCKGNSTIKESFCLEEDEILRKYFSQKGREQSYFVVWNKIYKKDLLLRAKADIEKTSAIMQKQTYAEDVINTFFAFKNAKKVQNIHTGYYFYHIHSSQSVSVPSVQALNEQVDAMTRTLAILKASVGENKYREEIMDGLNEWWALMSRTHYAYAKSFSFDGACEYVKNKYGMEKIGKSKASDSYGYIASGLLGENFEGIDTILRFIYKKGQDVSVNYNENDDYVKKSIGAIEERRGIKITNSRDAQLVIPKRKISLKSKILHSGFVISVGMKLFPKGSRLRRLFKSKL